MSISLTLPEPARGLFRSVRATLAELLPTVIDGDRGWWLGGGTVLAAQWQHRLSTDLDIFLPADSSLAPFDPRWTIGGTIVARTYRSGEALAEGMRRMGLEETMLGLHGTVRACVGYANARLR